MRPGAAMALSAIMLLVAKAANGETPGQIRNISLPVSATKTSRFDARVRLPDSPSLNESVIAIYYKKADGNTYICTGTLIASQIVLTAGHCGCGLVGSYWVNRQQNARLADPSQLGAVDGPPILYDQRVCRNGYLGEGNDLALIRLRDPVPMLATPNSSLWEGFGYPPELVFDLRKLIVKGSRLTVVGYGYTESRQIGVRNQGQVPVYSFDCEDNSMRGICSAFSEMVLADQQAGRPANDTCGGDSGGPVFWTQSGIPRLVAVTSRAAPGLQENAALHCGGGGIYVLLGRKSVHDWLEANGVRQIGIQEDGNKQMTSDEVRRTNCLAKGQDPIAVADCINKNP
jgi:secreted trypsin-like serine protease